MANFYDLEVMGPQYGHVDKFEGKKYMLWKFKIQNLLKARDLWNLVGVNEQKPMEINVCS